MLSKLLRDFVAQSNMIEGIHREPTVAEIAAHHRFLESTSLTIDNFKELVSVLQSDARLRDWPHLNVRVGTHIAPRGGADIVTQLQALLDKVNAASIGAWHAHCAFETLHPFTDGNGRSGRALWLWQMRDYQLPPGLFLHAFYYQTLEHSRS